MSSLPPANKARGTAGIMDGAEATETAGLGQQFTQAQINRRRGPIDRRHEPSGGGRRKSEADRRVAELQSSGEEHQGREQQPVVLEDDQGRLQPNPAANIHGVSHAERLSNAVTEGQPVGTVELKERAQPPGGVTVLSRVEGHTTERESGVVRPGMGEVDTSQAKEPLPSGTGAKGGQNASPTGQGGTLRAPARGADVVAESTMKQGDDGFRPG